MKSAQRLMEECEHCMAALDAAIMRGVADANAGRVEDAKTVFDALEAKYSAMAAEPGGV